MNTIQDVITLINGKFNIIECERYDNTNQKITLYSNLIIGGFHPIPPELMDRKIISITPNIMSAFISDNYYPIAYFDILVDNEK